MKTLIGVDGSAGSLAAVQCVGELFSAEKDSIVLYYSPPHVSIPRSEHPDQQLLARVTELLAKAVFQQAQLDLAERFGGPVQAITGTRRPAHGLLVAADEYRADLIVVGARGSGPINELSVGSVARAAVHHTTVPVLIVRPRTGRERGAPLRVLLASDGSASSKQACKYVHNFSWPEGATGRVVTVIESVVAGHIPEWLEEQLRQQEAESVGIRYFERTEEEKRHARDELVCQSGELPHIFQHQEPLVAVGHASQEILRAIEKHHIDLVVVGARGLGPIGRLLLGSTSEHLLTHAPCSLLIVRQHEKP